MPGQAVSDISRLANIDAVSVTVIIRTDQEIDTSVAKHLIMPSDLFPW